MLTLSGEHGIPETINGSIPEIIDGRMLWRPFDSPCPCPGPRQERTLMVDSADSDGNLPSKLFPESSRVLIAVRPERSGIWPIWNRHQRCTRVGTTVIDEIGYLPRGTLAGGMFLLL